MKRYCLALDLKDDPVAIALYIEHHKTVWPEVLESLKLSGIEKCEIYNTGNRLFMVVETDDNFSWEKKAKMDAENPDVQEWEAKMARFQQPLPPAKKGEKWILMEKIFDLK